MADQDQYDNVCKDRFDEILGKQDKLYNKLFLDNGAECLQSKINRHDGWIKRVMWVIGCVATFLIGLSYVVLRIYLN